MKICFSGLGVKSAYYAGKHGDGLVTLTTNNSFERCRDIIFPSFKKGASEAGKNPDEMEMIISLSFTLEDGKSFLKSARPSAGVFAKESLNERDPREIEDLGSTVTDEELLNSTYLCSSWDDVVNQISKFHEIGVTEVSLYSGPDPKAIRTYAKKVLPYFKRSSKRRKRTRK
jgi:alkanesulfonate monooxygenase SsuD/methylene tetrahydromethanopterin reductase-like flavin-dependent oxidoreductase (luciferase family)